MGWNSLLSETRQAWRGLWARPMVSLTVVAVLGVGVGLASAMFALADPYILRPLPYSRPGELVVISPGRLADASRPETITDWQSRLDVFAGVAGFADAALIRVDTAEGPVPLDVVPVSPSFFDVMGLTVVPAAWRVRPGSPTPIVLFSQGLRGMRSMTPGTELTTPEGERYSVVGTLPPSFVFPDASRNFDGVTALVPLTDERIDQVQSVSGGGTVAQTLTLVGRLRRGLTPEAGSRALDAGLGPSVASRPPILESLRDVMTRKTRPLAFGAVAAGLLVFFGCTASIASLLQTRVTYRRGEFATRAAVGATSLQLGRLVVIEVGLLAIAGVALGLVVAGVALRLVSGVMPQE